jgi:hypothetical protein
MWRIWIIWTGSSYAFAAVGLPLLVLLAALGELIRSYFSTDSTHSNKLLQAIGFFHIYRFVNSSTYTHGGIVPLTFFVLCTIFNVLVSLMVVGRLALIRRRITQLIGKYHIYTSLE